jgi:hypothetical protein
LALDVLANSAMLSDNVVFPKGDHIVNFVPYQDAALDEVVAEVTQRKDLDYWAAEFYKVIFISPQANVDELNATFEAFGPAPGVRFQAYRQRVVSTYTQVRVEGKLIGRFMFYLVSEPPLVQPSLTAIFALDLDSEGGFRLGNKGPFAHSIRTSQTTQERVKLIALLKKNLMCAVTAAPNGLIV